MRANRPGTSIRATTPRGGRIARRICPSADDDAYRCSAWRRRGCLGGEEVAVGDPDQTAYDSETGNLMVFGYLSKSIEATEYVQGTVEIEVDKAEVAKPAILEVSLFSDNIAVEYPWPC